MFKEVPGHARAITFWLLLILLPMAALSARPWLKMAGVLLAIAGLFLADQATHLDQPNHSDPADTIIERLLQRNRWPWVLFGGTVAITGFAMLIFT